MTIDTDIHFGDLEESAPDTRLRPDQNKHFAVVGYEKPSERDLPVFIDVDVVRDIEEHAQSDTSVELGGVLLGGQYVDEKGKPFVLITDSLRAEHYESTKGSFKFTHDTWSAITKERDEFPEDLQMVGWYHTHPDWGVFLSGMDMFICDNFFNKRLDVAYVVDPCRGDRGMFQWTGDSAERIRRTDGFYLIGSRFRLRELLDYSAWLEGGYNMAHDPRMSGAAGPYPAPVVNIAEQRSPWLGVAVLGMLMTQFLLLLVLALRIAGPPVGGAEAQGEKNESERVAQLEQSLAALLEARQLRAEADAQTKALDRVVSQLQNAPSGAVEALVEQEKINEELRAAIVGHSALRGDLQTKIEQRDSEIKRAQSDAEQEQQLLQRKVDQLQVRYDRLAQRGEEKDTQIVSLQERLERYEPSKDAEAEKAGGVTIGGVTFQWWAIAAGAVVIVVAAVGVYGWFSMGKEARAMATANDDAQFANSLEEH